MLRAVKGEDARYYFLYHFVGKVGKRKSCAERFSKAGQEDVWYMLGRDIVGYLAVKILKTDRELSHCFEKNCRSCSRLGTSRWKSSRNFVRTI